MKKLIFLVTFLGVIFGFQNMCPAMSPGDFQYVLNPLYTCTVHITIPDISEDCEAQYCTNLVIDVWVCNANCTTCHHYEYIAFPWSSPFDYHYSDSYPAIKIRFANDPGYPACSHCFNTAFSLCTNVTSSPANISLNLCCH